MKNYYIRREDFLIDQIWQKQIRAKKHQFSYEKISSPSFLPGEMQNLASISLKKFIDISPVVGNRPNPGKIGVQLLNRAAKFKNINKYVLKIIAKMRSSPGNRA